MGALRDSFPPGMGEPPKLDRLFATFEDTALERAFQKESFALSVRKYVRFSVLLSFAAFWAYGVHDLFVVPDVHVTAWAIRYGVSGPLGALLVAFVFRNRTWERHQPAMLVFGLTVNTVVLWIGSIAPPAGFFIYTGFAAIFVTLGPFLARMNVKTQIVYTVLTLALYNLFDVLLARAEPMSRLSLNFTLFTLGAIGTLAARQLEIQARVAFVQRQVIREQMTALDVERHRSESLLLNVLPRRIAERLKNEPDTTIAERFESATVLFSDIVGFTELSARLVPDEIVRRLDEVFSRFDGIADQLELEKIKTIGDAYMVAGGVPARRSDHAAAVCEMALRMREALAELAAGMAEPIAVRIGVHTGPVVAGVIGKKKFIYDVWGDTVNTASRMESHGVPGAIQVSEATYLATKDAFEYEERGAVAVKGKGEMTTYLLVGRRSDDVGRAAWTPSATSPQA
ncbi:MAG: adenylate/guanylate cyclase domain-containing protein [Labilithrix sp.]|nr:adenylate/guanylate cyclase domain-containing protein [Labilithrix sp.]MCW5830917.1 adenylate/guanylate cyclase domain-containing protein [Labilithrix sp.]